MHILKVYDGSYSKIIRKHKEKNKDNNKDNDNDNDNDKDKDTDKVPETPNICYILKSLWLSHSNYDDGYLTLVTMVTLHR